MPILNSYSEYQEAKNAYYNCEKYKGLVGLELLRAIMNYDVPVSGQHFTKTTFDGPTKNKATI